MPAAPPEGAPSGRPVLPADHALRPGPAERPAETPGQHDRGASRSPALPCVQHLAWVAHPAGEPLGPLIPARLGPGEVDDPRLDPSPGGERREQRFTIRNGNRGEDCNPRAT